jgi:hypothetical protein
MYTYRPIKKGTTDVTVYVRVIDSTDGTPETGVAHDTAGIDLWYMREGADHVSITEATQTAAGAHSDGGFVHISDGWCRLDLPDAACASGVDGVMVGGTITGMIVLGCMIPLVDYDPYDSVRAGLTALPNATAGTTSGLPVTSDIATAAEVVNEWETQSQADPTGFHVNVLEVNGTAQTANDNGADINAILADTNELQGDWTDGGRLDLLVDSLISLLDDARNEPGQGAPPVNPDAVTKIDYLYKAWRNRVTVDADSVDVYADNGTTVDHTATISDNGTTFDRGEMGSGA